MMTSPFLFLLMPGKASRQIAQRPLLWPALMLTCLAGIATLILRWPATVDAVIRHLPPSASAQDQVWVRALLTEDVRLRCAILPVIATVKLAALAVVVYVLGRIPLSVRSPRFRHIMILCAHAAFLLAFGELLAQLVGWSPFVNGDGLPGVAWIASAGGNYTVAALLRSFNVLTLWYVIALAVGLRVLSGSSSLRSFLVALAAWSVSILANLWLIRLMHDALHLRV